MSLKLCKGCFTMKNIRGKKIICKKCEIEQDKSTEKEMFKQIDYEACHQCEKSKDKT